MKTITVIRRCASYGALPLVAALASAPAGAAAWEFNPSVEAGYLYDDNYRLTTRRRRRSTCRGRWSMPSSSCAR